MSMSNIKIGAKILQPNVKHEPLRTFIEFCEEFNIDANSLAAKMRNNKTSPKPRIQGNNNNRTIRNSYYSPTEMRKWWKELNSHANS